MTMNNKTVQYDVVNIGSGMGGLTCGALLAKRGYKPLILEQGRRVGGYNSSFFRQGFLFNTGVEDVSGLWEKGSLTFLFKQLGWEKNEFFVPNHERIIFDRRHLDFSGDLKDLTF